MIDISRFDKVENRLKSEAESSVRLAKTAERIRDNIKRARDYELTPQRLNLLASNGRKGIDIPYNFSSYHDYRSAETVLDLFSKAGIPLAERIIEEIVNFRRDSSAHYVYETKHIFRGIHRKLIDGLTYRTMKENEYLDYLEGKKAFTRFNWDNGEIELSLSPGGYKTRKPRPR